LLCEPQRQSELDHGRRPGGLDNPRALDILTTEHWSLLSTRTLGYQEIFGRTTIFIAILSGSVIAFALLAQATRFGVLHAKYAARFRQRYSSSEARSQ
jgi:hypothetical protein